MGPYAHVRRRRLVPFLRRAKTSADRPHRPPAQGPEDRGRLGAQLAVRVYCLAQAIADVASERFGIGLRPVASVSEPMIEARQVVIDSSVAPWLDAADLNRLITPIHGQASETCADCGVTRWMPVGMDVLPGPSGAIVAAQPTVVASPEWFGAGKQSFRQILWRRDVAEFLVSSSPKDFKVQEVV
jgi:hypothetical protein